MAARLTRKFGEVAAAVDREASRLTLMRDRLAEIDPVVLLAAIDCIGSAEGAALWLTGREPSLDNACPLEVAATAEGKTKVLDLLLRLDRGMFAAGLD